MTDFSKLTEAVARRFWGEPNKLYTTRTELRWGSKGSKSLNREKGTWFDHEEGIGGGCIDLVMREAGVDKAQAGKWLEKEGYPMDGAYSNGHAAHSDAGAPQPKPKVVANYDYQDELREVLFRVVRLEWPATNGSKPPKTFKQYRPDGHGGWIAGTKGVRRVPYRLPDMIEAAKEGETIFIVEGEKKVDALWSIGVPATCNMGGSKGWKDDWSGLFRGVDLVILPDNDEPGRAHADMVAKKMAPIAKSIRLLELPGLPDKGDIIDWLEAGGTAVKLMELLKTDGKPWSKEETKAPAGPPWMTQLQLTKEGARRLTERNLALELQNNSDLEGIVALDIFARKMLINRALLVPGLKGYDPAFEDPYPRDLRPRDMFDFWGYFQAVGYVGISLGVVQLAVEDEAAKHPRHPVREYLVGLKWDGRKRIDRWLEWYCGAECETEAEQAYAAAVGSRWLISACARVFKPGCKADFCLILEGEQGVGKSTTFSILAGPWFSDSLPADLHHRDAALHLRGRWIIELSELSALGRSEMETVKSFLSRDEDRYRAPYARDEETIPRQCVFCGTTNSALYLKDATGARRFWPIGVTRIDLRSLRDDRDQLWAEAYDRYSAGEKWWFDDDDSELIKTASVEQESRYEGDVWHDTVRRYCDHRGEVSVADILHNALEINPAKQTRVEQMRIASILAKLGYKKSRRTANIRMWVKNGSSP